MAAADALVTSKLRAALQTLYGPESALHPAKARLCLANARVSLDPLLSSHAIGLPNQ